TVEQEPPHDRGGGERWRVEHRGRCRRGTWARRAAAVAVTEQGHEGTVARRGGEGDGGGGVSRGRGGEGDGEGAMLLGPEVEPCGGHGEARVVDGDARRQRAVRIDRRVLHVDGASGARTRRHGTELQRGVGADRERAGRVAAGKRARQEREGGV